MIDINQDNYKTINKGSTPLQILPIKETAALEMLKSMDMVIP
jgi:hypothetical protein